MASNFDKSLSEIIRAKGIQKPQKRRNKPYLIPSAAEKKISWNEMNQNRQRIPENESKISKFNRARKKISWKTPTVNGQGTFEDESKSSIVLTGNFIHKYLHFVDKLKSIYDVFFKVFQKTSKVENFDQESEFP